MAASSPNDKAPKKTFWTPGRIVITLVTVGLISAFGLSSCNSNETPVTNAPTNRVVITSAPANRANTITAPPGTAVAVPPNVRDTTFKTLDGDSAKLSDYNNKVLVVNLWATWCGPCRSEMPELVKMSNEYKSRGLVVLGLATTYNEQNDPTRVKDFVKAQNIPYKIIWDDGTLAAPLVQAVQGRSVIPQSFVIGRDGRIVKHFSGFSPYSTPQLMRQAIEDALNDKSKA
ncbi:MAG TPA: TlpA disulfide reductase family protein [Pyrinomonadaceae bacterium]|nr:TlpA disulfide reductase family protein [Pyrinomonadaceae bacterium]